MGGVPAITSTDRNFGWTLTSVKTLLTFVSLVLLSGYRAPETKIWNKWKEMQSNKRRRKLQGSFSRINLTNVTGLVSR